MDYTKDLHELCDMICDAVADATAKIRANGGKMSSGDVDYVDKLTHTMKSLKAVISMDDGRSMMPARRRYSRRYSGEGGMVDELRELMQDAPDERTRQEFKRFISKIESM